MGLSTQVCAFLKNKGQLDEWTSDGDDPGATVTSVSDDVPLWEQRIRAPQLLSFSLLGPAVSWAHDDPDRGVLLSTLGGRVEAFAFDASSTPASLTKVTNRPHGTLGAAMSSDASAVYWFDDNAGDEVGRWVRHDLATGSEITMLADGPASYSAGIRMLADGGAVIGRLIDDGADLVVATPDGSGRVAYTTEQPEYLIDATPDAALALMAFGPDGDWMHYGLKVIRLADGVVVAELVHQGKHLQGVGFRPNDSTCVLLGHEPSDRVVPALWNTATGAVNDIESGLEGDVTAQWYPDGQTLLLTALSRGRHTLHAFDLGSGTVTALPLAPAAISTTSPRPDGTVHVLYSRSEQPVSLARINLEGDVSALVELDGEPPPASTQSQDVLVEGPGGTVHALLQLPTEGSAPFPALFMPHGGPIAQDYDEWRDSRGAYLDAGYAVIRVNYRGSTGYGAAWRDALNRRVGFIEMEDLTVIRDHLEDAGVIEPARVSIAGGSWGGYLTLMAVGLQPNRWRSGAAMVPVADWITMTEDSPPFMTVFDRSLFGVSIDDEPELYRTASPISYVDQVVAPLFITAGENDPRCPVRQIDLYVEALRNRGHDVDYQRHETGHGVYDLDLRVKEVGTVLEFLARTNPV